MQNASFFMAFRNQKQVFIRLLLIIKISILQVLRMSYGKP